MAGIFNQPAQSETRVLIGRYNSARYNLIFIAVLTAINLLLLATGDYTYFFFSASVPYLLVDLGMLYCGKYPVETYGEEYASYEFLDPSFLTVMTVIALLIVAAYVVCFFLSKNGRVGWLITAGVLFLIDTLAMFYFYGLESSMIVNILLHIYAVVAFGIAIHAHYKLKAIATAAPVTANAPVSEGGEPMQELDSNPALVDSIPLRAADQTVKHRVLLSAAVYGHEIVYRRVKRTNELVIDGRVYDEYTALAEHPHLLTACLDGHEFGAGLDAGTSSSYVVVDGSIVVSKIRWI